MAYNLVRAVARAIHEAQFPHDDEHDPSNCEECHRHAVAAIRAMREPTHEMLLDGARSIGETMGRSNHIERSRPCWQAMIDTALDIPITETPQPLTPLPSPTHSS